MGDRVVANLHLTLPHEIVCNQLLQPPRVVRVLTCLSPLTASMSDVSSAFPRLVDCVLSFPSLEREPRLRYFLRLRLRPLLRGWSVTSSAVRLDISDHISHTTEFPDKIEVQRPHQPESHRNQNPPGQQIPPTDSHQNSQSYPKG